MYIRNALLASCLTALASGVSRSKLSLHVNGVDSAALSWIQATQPALLKLLDPAGGEDAAVKAVSPATFLVGRIYSASQPTQGDPAAAAAAWFAAAWPTIARCPQVDVWEGYNEPSVGDVASMAW